MTRARAIGAHVLVALWMVVAIPVIGVRELWRAARDKVRS